MPLKVRTAKTRPRLPLSLPWSPLTTPALWLQWDSSPKSVHSRLVFSPPLRLVDSLPPPRIHGGQLWCLISLSFSKAYKNTECQLNEWVSSSEEMWGTSWKISVMLPGAHLEARTWHFSLPAAQLAPGWENNLTLLWTQPNFSPLAWARGWGFSEPSAFSHPVTEPSRKAPANKGGPSVAKHSHLNKSRVLPVGPNQSGIPPQGGGGSPVLRMPRPSPCCLGFCRCWGHTLLWGQPQNLRVSRCGTTSNLLV